MSIFAIEIGTVELLPAKSTIVTWVVVFAEKDLVNDLLSEERVQPETSWICSFAAIVAVTFWRVCEVVL